MMIMSEVSVTMPRELDKEDQRYRRFVYVTCCNVGLLWTVTGYYMLEYLTMVRHSHFIVLNIAGFGCALICL